MIVPEPKPNEAPLDAPPAYDGGASSSQVPIVEKRVPPTPTSPASSSNLNLPNRSRAPPKSTWTSLGDDVGNLLSDLGLGSSQRRVAREVRKTVAGLIHDLVRDQTIDSNLSCVAILESCSEACAAQSVDLPALLRQAYIEGHTPLYWAIVKRPLEEAEPPKSFELPPLVRALLAYSAPLDKATIKDAQLACLHNCDQWLYQSLRLCPDFEALSHKDQLLLGVRVPPDTVSVGAPARHDAPFTVDFEFPWFQKRMRVSQEVKLEFISHGEALESSVHPHSINSFSLQKARMWTISFFVAYNTSNLNDGQWAARLSLSENSPVTNITASYILEEQIPDPAPGTPDSASVSLEINGKLGPPNQYYPLHVALPDAVQYPRSPFLTPEGTLRGKLTVQITNK
ncbi:hypothetical protein MSAN_00565700 [Mycena sanguinolenta]|uniref:Uncharacterized protein n=1 Tax=Mycena sanguinolenta TaxID=230812 RepID=A0A8H6Z751_9AGAR|nr:hypothetical protein MSAN_00565700 [Mycena sanguinolenta]